MCFAPGFVDYGQLIKVRGHGRVVCKETMVVYGGSSLGDVEAIVVERFNGILCERLGRFVRGSKCFSKGV